MQELQMQQKLCKFEFLLPSLKTCIYDMNFSVALMIYKWSLLL